MILLGRWAGKRQAGTDAAGGALTAASYSMIGARTDKCGRFRSYPQVRFLGRGGAATGFATVEAIFSGQHGVDGAKLALVVVEC